MAQENLVEFTLTQDEKIAAERAIATLLEILGPKLITLTAEERRNAIKLGDKSVAFMQKAVEYATAHADLAPAFLDISSFSADADALKQIDTLYNPLLQLVDRLSDTRFLSGSEAYNAALIFYSSVKTAAAQNVPNAKTILADLSERFVGQRNNRAKDTVAS